MTQPMRKKLQRVALISLGVAVCIWLALLGMYCALQHVPSFYAQAITMDAAVLEEASDEMGSRATSLASEVGQAGDWNALFTAEQINGWLAVDLARLHPGALPEDVDNLRVAIQPGRVILGFGVERNGLSVVYSVEADMYVSEPNVIAIRFVRARAGGLPVPLSQVLDTVTEAARRLELPLRWVQTDGDPVALVTVLRAGGDSRQATTLKSLELLDGDGDGGEVYVAGTTVRRDDAQKPGVATEVRPDTEHQEPE